MQDASRKQHWEAAYRTDGPNDVSWFQSRPEISLSFISATGSSPADGIIDVGGGASTLVDHLMDAGYSRLAVLDLSGSALAYSKARLGPRASAVEWFEEDVTSFAPPHRFAVWHDRAVFHFLTAQEDRRRYVRALLRSLQPGGHVIVATFAPDGPLKCSGLEIRRYDETRIASELGPHFILCDSRRETHQTPWQTEQRFMYFRFRHRGDDV